MRAKHPFSNKPQNKHSAYLQLNHDRPQLPVTRFTGKGPHDKRHTRESPAEQNIDRHIHKNIIEQGLHRMLKKAPRKEDM